MIPPILPQACDGRVPPLCDLKVRGRNRLLRKGVLLASGPFKQPNLNGQRKAATSYSRDMHAKLHAANVPMEKGARDSTAKWKWGEEIITFCERGKSLSVAINSTNCAMQSTRGGSRARPQHQRFIREMRIPCREDPSIIRFNMQEHC